MRKGLWLVALALAVGCKGDMGPMGPAGPQGPTGPQGPSGTVNRVIITGTPNADGFVAVELPAATGSDRNDPPDLACFEGAVGGTVWFAVADGWSESAPYCALQLYNAKWYATMANLPSGRMALFVVSW